VATELRQAMNGGTVDKNRVFSLIERYGQLDGKMSALYAQRFAEVNKTLTAAQREALVKLRDLDVVPTGAYKWSSPVAKPVLPGNEYLFGVGMVPPEAGQTDAPADFARDNDQRPPANPGAKPGDKPRQN